MKAVVVYESLWGNTAAVARAIAEGIGPEAQALSTAEATGEALTGVDLIVAGAPVLGFKLPTEQMRQGARTNPGGKPPRPADLSHPSMRSWLEALPAGMVARRRSTPRCGAPSARPRRPSPRRWRRRGTPASRILSASPSPAGSGPCARVNWNGRGAGEASWPRPWAERPREPDSDTLVGVARPPLGVVCCTSGSPTQARANVRRLRFPSPRPYPRASGWSLPAFWPAYPYDTWCSQWTIWTTPGRESEPGNTP